MISKIKRVKCSFSFAFSKLSVGMLIVLATISACSKPTDKQTSDESYHQSATLITISPSQSYTVKREYLGQVTAKQQTNLSFEFSGKVSKVFIDNGDVVKKGQLLAQQDTQLLGYKTEELHAQVMQAQAQITLNKANLLRIETLISDGYSSKQRFDELSAENKILQAQIKGLNAGIKKLAYQKERSALVAPFDGVITHRFLADGEVVSPTQVSFSLIESENIEITAGLPSKVINTLSLGDIIEVTVAGKNKSAKLIAIGQQIDDANRTVQLRLKMLEKLSLSNSYNGQLVRVNIAQKINKVGYWLPIDAITDGVRGQWQVLIASAIGNDSANYKLQSATINILHTNEDSVYINGLELASQNIIAQGVHRYVAGQIVKASTPSLISVVGKH